MSNSPEGGRILEVEETLEVARPQEWRAWLARHHHERQGIWLIYYKKGSARPSLSYEDSVLEALCYGWIDSQVKSLDQERFARRITPRRTGSHWASTNRARALRLLREGRMQQAGMAVLPKDLLRERDEGKDPRED